MSGVGIITFLHNDNYGSTLQAYALQRTVRELGFSCEHMDYRPDRKEKIRNLLESGNDLKLVLEGIRKRSVKAGQAGAREKSSAIPEFYRKYMKIGPVCRNRTELRKNAGKYDTLICGSDQIWNPVWLNPAYFLTFAPENTRKIAYAASLGVHTLTEKKKIRKIRKWTEGFQAVSVREEEGAELLKEITGKQAAVMPDPVCLLSPDEWAEIAEPATETEPYLLCYFIGDNDTYRERIEQIRKETGLKPLVIPVAAGSYRWEYERLDGIGPEAFLGAVRGAAMLCTDSFHGLAFGTIFNREIRLIRRYRDDDRESKNSRVDHFLRMTENQGMDRIRETGREWLARQLNFEN